MEIKSDIVKYTHIRDSTNEENPDNVAKLSKSRILLREKEKKLESLKKDAERQKKRRAAKRNLDIELSKESENAAQKLKNYTRPSPGRPPVEERYENLHQEIMEIAQPNSATNDRRRNEVIHLYRSLTSYSQELENRNIFISRQTFYLRLLPHRPSNKHGKTHVRTVPVRVQKPSNTARKKHRDGNFTFATRHDIQSVVSTFGPDAVTVISMDDKAKIPLGITAVAKQTAMVMSMEYQVRLPDHDFVVAPSHKLIPSVYAGCKITRPSLREPFRISYSGPMYIGIRSLKHESSTANAHGRDLRHLLKLPVSYLRHRTL